jgi:hypothetical protein
MASFGQNGTIFVGNGTKPAYLNLNIANHHGLITGSGTGKTVTIQVLAEAFRMPGSRCSWVT